jgi:hypothetical protein
MDEEDKHIKVFGIRRIILATWPFVLAVLVFLCVRLAIGNSEFVEHYYSTGLYPFIAKTFSSFNSLFPFSVWDVFWTLTVLLIISGLFLVAFKKIKLRCFSLRVAQFFGLLYSLFYFVWGFNYFRPMIEIRNGWMRPGADEIVFRSILDTLITHTNLSYTSVSFPEYSNIDILIEDSYHKNSTEIGINYPNGIRRTKTMLFSSFFAKLGVNGYFGPFFNEVHLNNRVLPMEYPFILAHEKAHQFGIASEAEANLAAFIVCTASEDRRLQYSGYVYILVYFLSDAALLKDFKDYINKIDKPVIGDLQFRRSYYKNLQKEKLKKVQTAANDAYLKTNHIEKGVKNYNQVVSLVISYYHNLNLNKGMK